MSDDFEYARGVLKVELKFLLEEICNTASRPYLEFIRRVLLDEISIEDIDTISKGRAFE